MSRATLTVGLPEPSKLYRWIVLIFVSLAQFGNYYIYDSINPLERIFHGENARDGGFADAAVPAENIAVCDTSLLDGVLEGAGDVLLPDDFGKLLRTVFSGENLVAHGRKFT